jgi:uncharacterized protein YecT (DUF1311 family)
MKIHLIIPTLLIIFFTTTSALAQTQSTLNLNSAAQLEAADDELNTTYQQIRKLYQDEPLFIKKLRAVQLTWIQFRDAQLEALYPLQENENPGYQYGSVYPMCYALAKTELTRTRIKEMKNWLSGIPEGEVCGGSIKHSHELTELATPTPTHRCNAEAYIIDEDPNGLNVRNAPSGNGQIISRIPYRVDGTTAHIIDAKKGWFKIDGWQEFNLSAKFNDDTEAWIYAKLLGLDIVGGGVTLYTQPSTQSPIKGKISPENYKEIKSLLDCQEEWLLVEIKLKGGKRLKGWLAPEEQCANPLTTCS